MAFFLHITMHVFFFWKSSKKDFYKNTFKSHIMEPFEIFRTFNITNAFFYVKPDINSCSVKIFKKQITGIISTVYVQEELQKEIWLFRFSPAKCNRCEQSFLTMEEGGLANVQADRLHTEIRMHNIKKNTRHELICMDVSNNITSAG